MALSLIVYPATDYNSFVTLTEADAIIETTVYNSSWSGLPNDDKMRYLITAYRNIMILDGILLPDTATTCLKESQSLMAVHDKVNGISEASSNAGQIQSAKVGSVAVTYTNGDPATMPSLYPSQAVKCLEDLGASINSNSFRFERA